MSASVPTSPSPLKSAVVLQGGGGQVPARHAKNASMSASVPTSPSQLKSAVNVWMQDTSPPLRSRSVQPLSAPVLVTDSSAIRSVQTPDEETPLKPLFLKPGLTSAAAAVLYVPLGIGPGAPPTSNQDYVPASEKRYEPGPTRALEASPGE